MFALTTSNDRDDRAAKNDTFFREISTRVTHTTSVPRLITPVSEWICECANETCTERVRMAPDEYDTVRQVASRYVIAPDDEHFAPNEEYVVERHQRYWIVQAVASAGGPGGADTSRAAGPRPISLRT